MRKVPGTVQKGKMKVYEAGASIEADPEVVWSILTDGAGLTTWDSGIEKFEGTIGKGGKIKLFSEASPGRAFPLKVTEMVANRRMVWEGGMPLGLFRGVRTYTLEPTEQGGTTFGMREEFTGLMLPLIWKSMPDLSASFTKFANGLKAEAEKAAQKENG